MPTDGLQLLSALVGRWTGEEEMAASPWAPAGPATSTVETEPLLDGRLVRQHYRQARDGRPSFESITILGREAGAEVWRLYQFDSAGFLPDRAAEGAIDGNDLTFLRVSPRGAQRTRFTIPGSGRYAMTIEFSPSGDEGPWQPVLRGTYTADPLARRNPH